MMQPYAISQRIQAEFLEMPGLRLTVDQTRRLCGVERALCQAILNELVGRHFLDLRADGTYVRVSEGRVPINSLTA
jgi:hypothetical protein